MDQITIIIGIVLTLSIFSMIFRDNPLYQGAEAIMIGFSAGNFVVIYYARAWELGFVPLADQFVALFATPFDSTRLWGLIMLTAVALLFALMRLFGTRQKLIRVLAYLFFLSLIIGTYLLLPMLVPVVLGILFYSSFIRPISWMVRLPLSFIFGFVGSLSLVMALDPSIWRQIVATVNPWYSPGGEYSSLGGLIVLPLINLDALIIMVGTVAALTYFFMTREHRGVIGKTAVVGRYFIMIALGAKFGSVCITQFSRLYERLFFLYSSGGFLVDSWFGS